MRDVHCHILPGVDDGARTMSESLLMISAAMKAGVTSIVCTPRCCDPFFNFERMWQAYLQLKHRVSAIPHAPELSMGFEVDYYKLKKLGMDAAVRLGNDQGEFLLQLPNGMLPLDLEYWVHQLQRKGFKVIIAHPERCREIQKDVEVARRFLLAGCELQISADCIYGSILDPTRRTAKKLVQAGMVKHLASDARCPSDYEILSDAMEYFKRLTDPNAMENKSIEEVERECAQAEARAYAAKAKAASAEDAALDGDDVAPADAASKDADNGEDAPAVDAASGGEASSEHDAAAMVGAGAGSCDALEHEVAKDNGADAAKGEGIASDKEAEGVSGSASKPSSAKLDDLALPLVGGTDGPRRAGHAAPESLAESALDSMYDDDDEMPVHGKHVRAE